MPGLNKFEEEIDSLITYRLEEKYTRHFFVIDYSKV